MPAVPTFPELRELELADKPLFDAALAAIPPQQSELTFTNLYIWRRAYEIRVSTLDDALCVFSWRADVDDSFVFPPLGGGDAETVRACLGLLRECGHAPRMARVTAEDIARLGLSEADFEMQPDRGNWDYLYRVEELATLKGGKYHNKRNHIGQFESRYPFFEYQRLTAEMIPECVALQDSWCDEKHCDLVATLRAEAAAVKEVLANLETLGVTGGAIRVDGQVQAFALGEALNSETVVIHIEKANGAFHGLYQMINQQFLRHEWQEYAYVNREQDLGVEGLRQAKLSYYPDRFVEKFVVRER
jgi:uncharacterized protein